MNRAAADNERFHASGGVCPQTVLWEFGSLSPARTFVKPPPRWLQRGTVRQDSEARKENINSPKGQKYKEIK